ncbi:MAG: RimK family alpha-L-glutamate ligase [Nitrososphaerota archaeon]
MTILEVIVDVVRLEEKLIINSLRENGLEVLMTNLKTDPLSWVVDEDIAISIIRPISMYRAVYSASIRESMNVQTINNSSSIMISGDKILTLSKLKALNISFPQTCIAFTSSAVLKAVEKIGFPLVDKPPVGSWGRLVTLVQDMHVLKSIIEHRDMLPSQTTKTHIIQKYVKDSRKDIRVLTLPNQIIGAVVRRPGNGEWRCNVALGGRTEPYRVDGELEELTCKVAETIGGEFIAVDVFQEDGRYLVNEVNGVPEFKGFMTATKINVPQILARHIKEKIKK